MKASRITSHPLLWLLCGALTISCSPTPARPARPLMPLHYRPYAPPPQLPAAPQPTAPQPTAPKPSVLGALGRLTGFTPKVAVLPIEDRQLFRQERAALRQQLHNELVHLMPQHTLVALDEVDRKLLPVSSKTGARCAYQRPNKRERVKLQGWAGTELVHVLGTEGKPEQLWVDVRRRSTNLARFTAVFERKLDRVSRYQRAFSQLKPNPNVGLLGGLGALADLITGVKAGDVTLCETNMFGGCKKSSAGWQDAVGKLSACFAGEDEVTERLLVQRQPGGARCEIINLDDTQGKRGKRETCLCTALRSSAAMAASDTRRALRVHHLDAALKDRPRPQLRLVEASTSLRVAVDWHQPRNRRDKRSLPPLNRLRVDNLDALAAPLSRCNAKEGSVLLAELTLAETGAVQAAEILTPKRSPLSSCAAKALKRGAFNCPDSGKTARLRVTIEWPRWPEKPAKPSQ